MTSINDIDPVPEKEEEEVIYEEGPWSKYLWGSMGDNVPKLLNANFYSVNSVFGFYYLTQFVLALAACNFYSDADRFLGCEAEDYRTPLKATTGLDMAILLLAIFHIIEWLRTTLLLMISCTGANLTIGYYISALNIIFGFVAYIHCYVTYFSEVGQSCIKTQEFRGKFLLAEVILFWVLFIPMIFPVAVLCCCKKQSHEKVLNKKDDDEGEE